MRTTRGFDFQNTQEILSVSGEKLQKRKKSEMLHGNLSKRNFHAVFSFNTRTEALLIKSGKINKRESYCRSKLH